MAACGISALRGARSKPHRIALASHDIKVACALHSKPGGLANGCKFLEEVGADSIYFEVANGCSPASNSCDLCSVLACRDYCSLPFVVRLVTWDGCPADTLPHLVEATRSAQGRAGWITFNSACLRLQEHLEIIRMHGGSAGIIVDSEAAVDKTLSVLDMVDHVEVRIQDSIMRKDEPSDDFSQLDLPTALIAIKLIRRGGLGVKLIAAGDYTLDSVATLAGAGIQCFVTGSTTGGLPCVKTLEKLRRRAQEGCEGAAVMKELRSRIVTFGVCVRVSVGSLGSPLHEAISNMVSTRQGRILLSRANIVFALVSDVSPEHFLSTVAHELKPFADWSRCTIQIDPDPQRFRRELMENGIGRQTIAIQDV